MPPVITGQSFVTKQVFELLKNDNWEVELLEFPNINSDGKIFIPVKSFFWLVFFVRFVLNIVSDPKIIYLPAARSILGFFRSALLIFLAKIFNHKLILHFHCGDYNDFISERGMIFRKFIIYTFKIVDYAIILGNSILQNFSLIFNEKTKIEIIPNGIRKIDLIPTDLIKKESCLKIVFMSNLIESKGYLDLLEAINILVGIYKFKRVECKFCGSFLTSNDDKRFSNIYDAKKYFFDFIVKNNLQENVSFIGNVTGEMKTRILNESDIFVLPTYYNAEAQPISILEAMSLGKIIISTNHRAIPDMIIHNFSGIIVNSHSPDEIAKSIYEINTDRNKQKALEFNSLNHFENNFSYYSFQEKILNVFNKVYNQM